jgi:hypothetical protein
MLCLARPGQVTHKGAHVGTRSTPNCYACPLKRSSAPAIHAGAYDDRHSLSAATLVDHPICAPFRTGGLAGLARNAGAFASIGRSLWRAGCWRRPALTEQVAIRTPMEPLSPGDYVRPDMGGEERGATMEPGPVAADLAESAPAEPAMLYKCAGKMPIDLYSYEPDVLVCQF